MFAFHLLKNMGLSLKNHGIGVDNFFVPLFVFNYLS